MNTEFFKVFPVLELSQECADWFSEVSVAKVAASKSKQRICIYIESSRLIPRGVVKSVEAEIKQCFWVWAGKYSNSRALYLV